MNKSQIKRLLAGLSVLFLVFCAGYYASFFVFILNGLPYPLAQGSALFCAMYFDLIPLVGVAGWVFEV